ncbi:uncharacterized protein SPPG_06289 [Spizellomyces punctatus DAOM BR117]|uniref:Pseudouridine synthase RsuA/RluA-like domain-containing protein n=1 Tax=Spizellomyces punctatus (strain DAOM BR117) TaxID=645134 RepID=A0A0L0HD20_SPIPD|nr:uncharacterized protein SPPG_06289 [Spizellomyces punctatus DAOM BR117]KNC98608.1 hypothetical protein SPPG_06289 [Spizellomyces punctatus DAOM BR117]|eukprot:XP_016606648.1 hypothetical protein SPPG_06289 [Spizellomyces punctatus DAOM BR117]
MLSRNVRWWLPLVFLTKFLSQSILSGLGTMVTDELEGPPQSFASAVLETVGAKQPMQQLTPLKSDINVPILEQKVEEGIVVEESPIQEDFANDNTEKSIQEDLANPHIETVEEAMVEEPISQIERETPIVSSMPETIPESDLIRSTQHAQENIAVLAVNSSASTDSDPADSESESTSVEVVALVDTTSLSPSPSPPIVVPGYDPRYQRNYDIEVLYYQPDTYLITNKPWDLRIDGDTTSCPTSESLLYAHFTEHKKLYLLHQLDYVTSGVHCWGLSKKAASVAGKCFVRRQVKKTYSALVKGHIVEDDFLIDKPLTDDPTDEKRVIVADGTEENPGKPSETRVQVLKRGYFLTYPVTHVMLSPRTGRRHQLRVHLASIGHPIIGDPAYERPHTEEAFRTMLHSWKLELPVPGDQPLKFEASEPFEILVKDEPGNWDAIPKRIPLIDPAPSPSLQKAVNDEEPGMPKVADADEHVVDAQKIVDEHLRLSYEYEAYWKDALKAEAAQGEGNREIATEEDISDAAGHAAISNEVTHDVSHLDTGLDAVESTEDKLTAEADDEAQKTVNEHLKLSYEYEAHWRRTLELDEEQQAKEVGDADPVVAASEETEKGNGDDTIPVIADVLSVVPAAGFMDTSESPSNPVEGVPTAISPVEGNQSPTEPAVLASDDTSTVIPAKRTCDEVFQETVVPAKRGADDTPLTTPATPSKKVNMMQDHGELEEKTDDDDLDQSQTADGPVEEEGNDETPAPQVIPAEGADYVSEAVAEVQPVERALVDDDAVVSMEDTAAEGEPATEGISAEGIDFASQTAVEEVQTDETPLPSEAAEVQIHEGLPADHTQGNVQPTVETLREIPQAELEEAVTEKQSSEVAEVDEGITAGEEVTIGEQPMEVPQVEVEPEQPPTSLYIVASEVPELKNVIELPEESVIQSNTLESAKDAAEEDSVLVSTIGDVLGADVEPSSVENVALQDQLIEAVCEIISPAGSETISEVEGTVKDTEPAAEESLKKIETFAAEQTGESVDSTDSVVANELLKDAVAVPIEREVGITAPEEAFGTSEQESVVEAVVNTIATEVEGVAEETLRTAPVNVGDAEDTHVHMETEPEVSETAVRREEPAEQPNEEVACMATPADVVDAARELTVEEEPLEEPVTESVISTESVSQTSEPEEQHSPIVEESVGKSVAEPVISAESALQVPEPEESIIEESVGKSVAKPVVSTESISQAPEPAEPQSPIIEDSDGESVTEPVVPAESFLQNADAEEHYSPAETVPPPRQDGILDERSEITSEPLPSKDDVPAPKAKGGCILL